MNIHVQQESSMRRTGWWDWSVWLAGLTADLDQIEFVEYVLHSSFPEPVQRRTDRSSGFRLNSSGWGEFLIHIYLHTRDEKLVKLEHWLRLSESAPVKGVDEIAEGKSRGEVHQEIETVETATSISQPKLFLSYAVADAPVGEDLRDALSSQGFDVAAVDSLVGSESSESLRADPGRRFQAAVFLNSEVRSPWLSRELEAARAADLPIVAVTVGRQARVPADLSGAPQVHLKDSSDVEYAAASIARRFSPSKLPPIR